jgi:hypothetical protein
LLFAPFIASAQAAELTYKERLLAELVRQIPERLKHYDPKTGYLDRGVHICQDQNRMFSYAVAYATPGKGNTYYKNRELLEVIVKAGDALIAEADEQGQWVFRKKDNSTWGMIRMPWTYSRWIRTFALIADDMPADRREAWTKALTLGYTNISRKDMRIIHNIPTHHAMGLYAAGKTLQRPEWCKQASEFLMKVIDAQSEAGCWYEGGGPVVAYDSVYIEALGIYYALSHDRRVLPALEKAAKFHYHMTYPDGRAVETVDQRNPYHDNVSLGNVGFTFTPLGRAHLARQWANQSLGDDLIANLLLYGEEGPVAEPPAGEQSDVFALKEKGMERAAVVRRGPWFFCLSAYTSPVTNNRWHQDRQNCVSIFHDKVGLILGGGNTKLQPRWSTVAVGDVSLLSHKAGDTNPVFIPPAGKLFHVPSAATLVHSPDFGLDLTCGPEECRIRVKPKDDRSLQYHVETTTKSAMPVVAHLVLLPHVNKTLETGAGVKKKVDAHVWQLKPAEVGGSVTYAGYRLTLPSTATVEWPCLPHNPYRKDGRATLSEGRLVVAIPLDASNPQVDVLIEIVP